MARSIPMAQNISGLSGTEMATLTDFLVRRMLSMNSGNVTQSQGMPSLIQAMGTASLRVMASMVRSRSSGRQGAKPNPQLPIATVVTPCQPDEEQ